MLQYYYCSLQKQLLTFSSYNLLPNPDLIPSELKKDEKWWEHLALSGLTVTIFSLFFLLYAVKRNWITFYIKGSLVVNAQAKFTVSKLDHLDD